METIELQQNVPNLVELTIYEDESAVPLVPMDITGYTVFVSVKKLNDYKLDDTEALISSKITVHVDSVNGRTNWETTQAECLIPLGRYKADVRVYKDILTFENTRTFYIDIVPVVTQRLV